MPFQRPTLSQIKAQVAADIQSALPGSDPLLRFSNLGVMGNVQSNLANDHYGYLDYTALQAVPWTATGENAYAWGAMKGITPDPAVPASNGAVTFTGENGKTIPDQTQLAWGSLGYTVQGAQEIVGGQATATATCNTPGAAGNAPIGAVFTLASAIDGINSNGSVTTAFTNGEDAEDFASFRTKMLGRFAKPPQGGAEQDYVNWALSAPGVTRAWCQPLGMGPGTVVVYVMMDQIEAAHNGFPQGANGVAAAETRSAAATGDQLVVANFLFSLRPVQACVYVCSPIATAVNFTVEGIANAPASVKNAVEAALAAACTQVQILPGVTKVNGQATFTIDLQPFEAAVAAVPGAQYALVTSPAGNITLTLAQLPQLGTVTFD